LVGAEGEDLINVPRFDFTGTFENQRCFGVFANTGEVILERIS
jgi:hypothetical protein